MKQQYMIHYNNTENRPKNRPKHRANSDLLFRMIATICLVITMTLFTSEAFFLWLRSKRETILLGTSFYSLANSFRTHTNFIYKFWVGPNETLQKQFPYKLILKPDL